MEAKLLSQFDKADFSILPNIHSLARTLDQSLWVLVALKDVLKKDSYFGAAEIRNYLLKIDVSVSELGIERALARSKNKVDREKTNGVTQFKIMQPGRHHVMSLQKDGLIA